MILNNQSIWYEEEVKAIENQYTQQIENCETELDVNMRIECDIEIQSRLFYQSREERRRISKRIKRLYTYSLFITR